MEPILRKSTEWNSLEMVIDKKIFDKDVVLKAAFNFIDRGYFLFSINSDGNILLQYTPKDDATLDSEKVVREFTDDLLEVFLRDKLEKDNRVIREAIITKSLLGPLDIQNFVTLDTQNQTSNQIDFDKDIDEILKEIENDPELKIDEEEIEKILKEIEAESWSDVQKPTVSVDLKAVEDVKLKFKK
jgi:His-Xaa-Ser system protein HxsD